MLNNESIKQKPDRIDRESPVPAYHQIAMDIRERVRRQEWKVDDQIPNELDLAKEYDVSRVTMRQAMAELVKDGILTRQRGKGTFISDNPLPLMHDLSLPHIFGQHLKEMGLEPSWQVLQTKMYATALPEVAQHLNIPTNTPIAYLKRLLLINDQPTAVNRSWLSETMCPGITTAPLKENSLSSTLWKRYQLVPTRTENWLEIIRATGRDGKLLQVASQNSSLLLLTAVSYLEDGTPLEYSMTSWLGDRVRFHFGIESHDQIPSMVRSEKKKAPHAP